MLHTLNKAWVNCCLNQAKDSNKCFLFVVKDDKEFEEINKITSHFFQTNTIDLRKFGYFCITTESEVYDDLRYFNKYYPMWDDILISHDIHDWKIKDFLQDHRIIKY